VPGTVVSERLAHASEVITLGTYPHTLPGMQREAASKLAAMVLGS
jgi:integrase